METADTIAYYQVVAYVNDAETTKSEVVKIEAFNDSDSDLLTDEDEQKYGTNPNNIDTDGDGLSDYEEVIIYNTNPLVIDTDGDGLNDYEEVYLTATDPTKIDTDNNGISDSDEDSDNDGLINKEEIFYGTDPIEYDTDLDGISDSDEIFVYKTNPVAIDTDNDKLSDGDEILQGTDPNNSDTNGNGILDGDEIIERALEVKDEEMDKNVTPSLNINISAGDASDLELLNLENDNYLIDCELPEYMGAAFKLISAENIEGTLTFKYENYCEVPIQYTSITEEVQNEPAIYKFNTQTGALEYMENQSWNKEDKTVITVITEPGIYILVDKYWFEKAWEKEYLSPEYEGKTGDIDIVFSIDDSGSMDWNDSSNKRLDVTKNFIDQLRESDRASIIGFSSNANNFQNLTSDKELLKSAVDKCGYSSGGTNLTLAINKSFDEISLNSIASNNRYVVLLTDGEDSGFNRQIPTLLEKAKELGIRIYTIGLGNSVNINDLKWIAQGTGGKYMNADNADELYEIFKEIGDIIDLNADSDSDGIPDYFEMNGIRLASGKTLYTDPFNGDTDNDGLSDGQEVGNAYNDSTGIYSIIGSNYDRLKGYWSIISDPTKSDTDKDNVEDSVDKTPTIANNVYDRDLSIAAQLSYTNLEKNYNDKLIDDLEFKEISYEMKSEMNGWKVIDSIKSNTADWPIVSEDAGLGALVLKKRINGKDRVIIAYRGSELKVGTDFINDMLLNNISGFMAGVAPQVKYAVNFYKKIVSENKNADIYVTGHSLGGFLAQKVGYTIIDDNSFIDIFKWNTKEPTKAATFNGYGPLSNICNVSSIIFDPIITYKMSKMYTHYYNKHDLVGDYLGAGYRFGIGNDINTTHYLGVAESEHYDACQQGGPYPVLVFGNLHSVNHFWEYGDTLTRN